MKSDLNKSRKKEDEQEKKAQKKWNDSVNSFRKNAEKQKKKETGLPGK